MQEPKIWIRYLYLIEFAYNALHQRSTGMSPFKALYGQECLIPLKRTDPMIRVQAFREMLDEMQQQTDIMPTKGSFHVTLSWSLARMRELSQRTSFTTLIQAFASSWAASSSRESVSCFR